MKLLPLQTVTAVKIHECYKTNSSPLRVECEDGNEYVIKTIFNKAPPLVDIINEVLCNYFLQVWNISTASQVTVRLDDDLIQDFVSEGNIINDRYVKFDMSKHIFFGVKYLPNVTEFDIYNLNIKDKRDFKRYKKPLDFLKIATFDKWIGNMDRRKGNSNLLLANDNGFIFVPIDHTQAFAYQENYKKLNLSILDNINDNSIMLLPMFKSICKFAEIDDVKSLSEDIIVDINNTIDVMDDVFGKVPSSFGLSKKAKESIKTVLSNNDRNNKISKIYLNYCK